MISSEERCEGCIADAAWPCKTTLTGGGAPIYLGCRKAAQARYADGDPFANAGNEYEPHGPEVLGRDGKYHRESRLK